MTSVIFRDWVLLTGKCTLLTKEGAYLSLHRPSPLSGTHTTYKIYNPQALRWRKHLERCPRWHLSFSCSLNTTFGQSQVLPVFSLKCHSDPHNVRRRLSLGGPKLEDGCSRRGNSRCRGKGLLPQLGTSGCWRPLLGGLPVLSLGPFRSQLIPSSPLSFGHALSWVRKRI